MLLPAMPNPSTTTLCPTGIDTIPQTWRSTSIETNKPAKRTRLFHSIHQRRNIRRSKPIIDIHYSYIRRAGVQHPEQCSHSTERCTVSNTRRHSNHWNSHQSANHRGQRTFHPGTHNQHGCLLQALMLRQQTVQPSNPHIDHHVYITAH